MTAPLDKDREESLKKALQRSREAAATGDPTKILQQLETQKAIERELGILPTMQEERQQDVEKTVGRIREQTEKARLEGRARGEALFGQGALGRVGQPGALGQVGATDPLFGGLREAEALARERATEGLTTEEEQILRERQERQISQGVKAALRQQRSLASQAGQRGETARAREADILKEQIRAQKDLAAGLTLADIEQRRKGLEQFGQISGQLGQLELGRADIAQRGEIANLQARFQEQAALTDAEKFNIRMGQTEKERLLTTELANVGLQQATESIGVQRTLQAIGLDLAQKNQERAFSLQQQELDKPPPEQPSGGGKFAICTELHHQGLMSTKLYNNDQWGNLLIIDKDMTEGYHLWAIPLTRLMRRSVIVTALMRPLGVAWAKHMSYLIGRSVEDSLLGKVMFSVGKPLCKGIWKLRNFLKTFRREG